MSLSFEMFQKIVKNVYLKALLELGKKFSFQHARDGGTAWHGVEWGRSWRHSRASLGSHMGAEKGLWPSSVHRVGPPIS